MLKALFWRINFFLKNRKSAKINRQLGSGVKSVIVDSKNDYENWINEQETFSDLIAKQESNKLKTTLIAKNND